MNSLITEAEITTCSRTFLRKNEFEIITSSGAGDKLYYRIKNTIRPNYKQPDTVAIKNKFLLIFEDKKKYNDLFKSSSNNLSDIEKLHFFSSNIQFVNEFKEKVNKVVRNCHDDLIIGCGCSSLLPKTYTHKIPSSYIYISIKLQKKSAIVSLEQSGSFNNIFKIQSCTVTL